MKQLLVATVLAKSVATDVARLGRYERKTGTAADTDLSSLFGWRLDNRQHGTLTLLGEMGVADWRRGEVERPGTTKAEAAIRDGGPLMDHLSLRNLLDRTHPVPFHGVAAGGATVNTSSESYMLQFSVPLIVM